MKNFLFPKPSEPKEYSLLLLALRLFFGIMLMMHGLVKVINFTELRYTFPEPIGLGREMLLLFVIFGEFVCSVGFILGALYRLCLIPMILVMAGAFFVIHGGSIAEGELAFLYLIVFVLMFIAGPGRFSVDALIYRRLNKETLYEY